MSEYVRRRPALAATLIAVIPVLILFYILPTFAQSEADPAVYQLVGSYYNVEHYDATLMLNNKGSQPTEHVITLFSQDGQAEEVDVVTVGAASWTVVSLNDLTSGLPDAFRRGSLEVTYAGDFLEVGAQIRLKSGDFLTEEQLSRPAAEYKSNRLEGLWWLPSRQANFRVAVTNTSDTTIHARVRVRTNDGSETRNVTLPPRASKILDGGQVARQLNSRLGAISIRHSGEPGEVIAHGLVIDEEMSYSASVHIGDPALAEGNELHGAGLRLGSVGGEALSPALIVRNSSTETSSVTVSIPMTVGDEVYTAQVGPYELEGGQIRLVSQALVEAISAEVGTASIDSAGIEVSYTGEPGSVMAVAMSASSSGNHVFRVPMKNRSMLFSSAGGYPFHLGDGENTIFYVKNLTAEPQRHTWSLVYDDGTYASENTEIQPGATISVDIRQLRDEQIPGLNGDLLPDYVTSGQLKWSRYKGEAKSLTARIEQVNAALGTAITYGCQNCCPDSTVGFDVFPTSIVGTTGAQVQMSFLAQTEDCYGFPGTIGIPAIDVDITPPSFVSVTSGGLATCNGAGIGNVVSFYEGSSFLGGGGAREGPNPTCEEQTVPLGESTPITAVEVSFVPNPLNHVENGQLAVLDATVDPASSAGNVSFESANTSTATVAQIGIQGATVSLAVTANTVGSTKIRAKLQGETVGENDVSIEDNPTFDKETVTKKEVNPSFSLEGTGLYGATLMEKLAVSSSALRSNDQWCVRVDAIEAEYSVQARLLPGTVEITGPGPQGNTTSPNFCEQTQYLSSPTGDSGLPWGMLQSTVDHENVHVSRHVPILENHAADIENQLEAICTADQPGLSQAQAIANLQSSQDFVDKLATLKAEYQASLVTQAGVDHHLIPPPLGAALQATLDAMAPLKNQICTHATQNSWPICPHCP